MNVKLLEQFDMFYKLKCLIRYNNRMKIETESVAEHSYYVTLFTNFICDKVKDINRTKALQMALIHDIPEIYISDIPYPTRKMFPSIEEESNKAELEIIKEKLSDKYLEIFKEFNDKKTRESLVVELADILSVLIYANNEILLGNKTMKKIFDITLTRYHDILKRLELTEEELIFINLKGDKYDRIP